jgi:hypothetical protein
MCAYALEIKGRTITSRTDGLSAEQSAGSHTRAACSYDVTPEVTLPRFRSIERSRP